MNNSYDNPESATAFAKFVNSQNGKFQQELLWQYIEPELPVPQSNVLDACAGQGWLTEKLLSAGYDVEAFDSSQGLVDLARAHIKDAVFIHADVGDALPYPDEKFDAIILNMAGHDIQNLKQALSNLQSKLKPAGKFIMTLANPYYSYPVAVWKRGLWGKIFGKFPKLISRPYHLISVDDTQLHNWQKNLHSHFRPLSQYINLSISAGFRLSKMQELKSSSDSTQFDSQYQLYRYPTIIALVFEKSVK